MKKACRYCGGIHEKGFICEKKPQIQAVDFTNAESEGAKFRSSYKWRVKRKQITKRDRYLCRACLAVLPGTVHKINPYRLSVHHIVPLQEDISKGLDSGNLITLCQYHHEQAESGGISREVLVTLADNPPHTL